MVLKRGWRTSICHSSTILWEWQSDVAQPSCRRQQDCITVSLHKKQNPQKKQAVIKCSMFASIYHFSERSPVSLRWSHFSETFNYVYCWWHSQILLSNYNLMSGAEDVRAHIIFTWPSKYIQHCTFWTETQIFNHWAKAEAVVYCLLLWFSWQQQTDGHNRIWEENWRTYSKETRAKVQKLQLCFVWTQMVPKFYPEWISDMPPYNK